MYFVRINKLKSDITAGELTDGGALPYYLIYIIFNYVFLNILLFLALFPSLQGPEVDLKSLPNLWDGLGFASGIVIFIIGNLLAYRANQAGDGKDFLNRVFSISFVTGVRFIPLFILVFIFALFLDIAVYQREAYSLDNEGTVPTSPIQEAAITFTLALFYWRIYKHIHDVANTKPE